jgi:signal transduction histidine kinase
MAHPVAIPGAQTSDSCSELRGVRLAGWVVVAIALVQVLAALILAMLNDLNLRGLFADYFVTQTISTLAFTTVGVAIVARRPGNVIGRLLCLISAGTGFNLWLFQYARHATVHSVPWGDAAVWLSLWSWAPMTATLLILLALIFPDGRLPSRRWRPALVVLLLAGSLLSLSIAVDPASSSPIAPSGNPLVSTADETLLGVLGAVAIVLVFASLACAIAAPVVRYRRSSGDERQQIKWFSFATAMLVAAMVTPSLVDPRGYIDDPLLSGILLTVAVPLLPVSVGIAVLRYRLYDIDLLINRTLVYGALTACVLGLYVFVVGYLGMLFQAGGNLWVSLTATGLVAMLFQPLRSWLQIGVNRLLYGERDEPYTVLSRLSRQLEETLAPDAALETIVQSVAKALNTGYAAIWLLDGTILRPGTVHGSHMAFGEINDSHAVQLLRLTPDGLEAGVFEPGAPFTAMLSTCGVDAVLPLFHRGDLVGTLCVAPRSRGEAFSVADRRLLRDLARQAGAPVQAVQLTVALRASLAELRRSRERLVMAQEEERRRIQRDLHDGLAPTLASMRTRIEGSLELARTIDPLLVSDLERLDELAAQAGADIRRLVYDLRPPVLDQLGLETALRQYVERFGREHGISVTFTMDGFTELPAASEVALFRIVQEALANIQKHAGASLVSVELLPTLDRVTLHISDDGCGLLAPVQPGTGLASMRERAELSGGSLTINSTPEGGTQVTAMIPVRSMQDDTDG